MSDRKVGNNKETCKLYKAAGRLERNKKRNKARAERQAAKALKKNDERILKGKPVRSRVIARNIGTSKGNMPNGAHKVAA